TAWSCSRPCTGSCIASRRPRTRWSTRCKAGTTASEIATSPGTSCGPGSGSTASTGYDARWLAAQDDLAEPGVARHALVGGGRGVEVHDGVDHGRDQAAPEQRHDLGLERPDRGDLLLERPGAQHGAEDPEPLAQHAAEVDLVAAPGHQADQHDPAEHA